MKSLFVDTEETKYIRYKYVSGKETAKIRKRKIRAD